MLNYFKQPFIFVLVLGLFLSLWASVVSAGEIKELERGKIKMEAPRNEILRLDRVLCVGGLKIFQTIAVGHGGDTGASVSNIQLYEERGGKTVPVRCDKK